MEPATFPRPKTMTLNSALRCFEDKGLFTKLFIFTAKDKVEYLLNECSSMGIEWFFDLKFGQAIVPAKEVFEFGDHLYGMKAYIFYSEYIGLTEHNLTWVNSLNDAEVPDGFRDNGPAGAIQQKITVLN